MESENDFSASYHLSHSFVQVYVSRYEGQEPFLPRTVKMREENIETIRQPSALIRSRATSRHVIASGFLSSWQANYCLLPDGRYYALPRSQFQDDAGGMGTGRAAVFAKVCSSTDDGSNRDETKRNAKKKSSEKLLLSRLKDKFAARIYYDKSTLNGYYESKDMARVFISNRVHR